jgi:hypothetical protein
MRAASAYKEQMEMLDFLVDLGFPFELLFPIEPRIDDNLRTNQQRRDYILSTDTTNKKRVHKFAASGPNTPGMQVNLIMATVECCGNLMNIYCAIID